MITNNWDWEGIDDDFWLPPVIVFTICTVISGLIGTILLFTGYFAWYLAILPLIWVWVLYKGLTSADFYFRDNGAAARLWYMYCDLPKPVRKEIGKVKPQTLRDLGDVDRNVLEQHWARARDSFIGERAPAVNPNVVTLLERSESAARKFAEPLDTP